MNITTEQSYLLEIIVKGLCRSNKLLSGDRVEIIVYLPISWLVGMVFRAMWLAVQLLINSLRVRQRWLGDCRETICVDNSNVRLQFGYRSGYANSTRCSNRSTSHITTRLRGNVTGWLWCDPGPAGHTKLRIYDNHKPTI